MALAKSMSEKIDDADMQRSWSKVKSLAEKKKPAKKKPVEGIAAMAADAKPSPLDELSPEAQLMASTILERQGQPVPESAKADIAELAARFAAADEGMWAAADAMAKGAEPRYGGRRSALRDRGRGEPYAEIMRVEDKRAAAVVAEDRSPRSMTRWDAAIYSTEPLYRSPRCKAEELAALEAMIVNPPEPIKVEVKPTLKVHVRARAGARTEGERPVRSARRPGRSRLRRRELAAMMANLAVSRDDSRRPVMEMKDEFAPGMGRYCLHCQLSL